MDGRLQTGNAWKGLVAGILGGLIAAWTMGQFHVLVTKLPGMQSPNSEGRLSVLASICALSRAGGIGAEIIGSKVLPSFLKARNRWLGHLG